MLNDSLHFTFSPQYILCLALMGILSSARIKYGILTSSPGSCFDGGIFNMYDTSITNLERLELDKIPP